MKNFLEPIKMAFREAMAKSTDEKINQAFRNGVAVGMAVGVGLASFGWIAFFWLASLSR